MSLLFRIVYAAHANGTHHKLALDALQRMQHPQAEAWQRVFLKHAALYLEGSKDPDNKFKDFKNHVLHVRDNYWGGAPEKVQNWYQHVVAALTAQNWSEAVYAAGVLSHYYTDPVQPFHTGQTEAENNIHRAAEWSINRSYDTLKALGERSFAGLDVAVPPGEGWLREMTLNGAEFSNKSYEKLIAHYDITRGVVDPPAGLDAIAQKLVAELLIYAATGFAHILDRAFEDSGQTPPEVSLTAETVLAGLQIPVKALQKKLSNAADRELVQRMYDELKTTGTVEKTLPEDDRMVRDLHAVEVLAPREKEAALARAARLVQEPAAPTRPRPVEAQNLAAPPAPVANSEGATDMVSAVPQKPGLADIEIPAAVAAADEPILDEPALEPVADEAEPAPVAEPAASEPTPIASAPERPAKIYLSAADDVERAPSIGAKTARRLANVGVTTVADFLEEDADQLATMMGQRSITGRMLRDWQDQARLVMAIPGLRGTHAQLLVGAGYRKAEAIAEADADALCAAVVKFAMTSEGQSVLRDGNAPDIAKIKGWMDSAAQAAHAA